MIINLVKNMRMAVEQESSIAHRILLFEAIREIERLQKKVVTAEIASIQNSPILRNTLLKRGKSSPLTLVSHYPAYERVMP